MKKVLKEHYLKIDVFLKQDANILSDHRPQNHKIELAKSK